MLILIKGAGDIATGIAVRLKNAGMQVVMTEIDLMYHRLFVLHFLYMHR